MLHATVSACHAYAITYLDGVVQLSALLNVQVCSFCTKDHISDDLGVVRRV
jgi:hypothetical protein